jgi:hypothetical protein
MGVIGRIPPAERERGEDVGSMRIQEKDSLSGKREGEEQVSIPKIGKVTHKLKSAERRKS